MITPTASFAGGIACADNPNAMCYGDFMATDAWFRDVREASTSGDALPLFGNPNVSGNSLDFDPVGFSAFVDGPVNGSDLTDSNLRFMVEAKPLRAIQNLKFQEAGDVTLTGISGAPPEPASPEAFASVRTPVFIDIDEVDGVGIDPIKLQAQMSFSPSGGDFFQSTDGGQGPLFNTIWNGMLFVDIEQELIDRNIDFDLGATKVTVNLDNTLMAVAQQGLSALIAKKDADGVIITVNIPEPAAGLLALMSVLAAAVTMRRR